MSKFTLILNSHALGDLSQCETKYLYRDILNLASLKTKKKMELGTQIAKWLEIYYYNKIKGPRAKFAKTLFNPLIWYKQFIDKCQCSQDEAKRYYRACFDYSTTYVNETWVPLAVEKGFSRVIYEDEENYFVYEGRPDLYAQNNNYNLVSDHKVQFKEYDIYPYNNQAYGYLWALGAKEFVYNYIKILSKTIEFRRIPTSYDSRAITNWQSNSIETYFRAKRAIQKQSFTQSYQCTEVYGLCPFTTICEANTSGTKLFVIQANYKSNPVYRSW